jgi:hypothetical protein
VTDRVDLPVALELSIGALVVLAVILVAVGGAAGLGAAAVAVRAGAILGALGGWAWMLRIALLDPEV